MNEWMNGWLYGDGGHFVTIITIIIITSFSSWESDEILLGLYDLMSVRLKDSWILPLWWRSLRFNLLGVVLLQLTCELCEFNSTTEAQLIEFICSYLSSCLLWFDTLGITLIGSYLIPFQKWNFHAIILYDCCISL